MIHFHTFAGTKYRIENDTKIKGDDLGECDLEKKVVRIPIHGDTQDDLDTIIHEAIHASCPWMDDWMVYKVAESVTRLLWRLKWRKDD